MELHGYVGATREKGKLGMKQYLVPKEDSSGPQIPGMRVLLTPVISTIW